MLMIKTCSTLPGTSTTTIPSLLGLSHGICQTTYRIVLLHGRSWIPAASTAPTAAQDKPGLMQPRVQCIVMGLHVMLRMAQVQRQRPIASQAGITHGLKLRCA